MSAIIYYNADARKLRAIHVYEDQPPRQGWTQGRVISDTWAFPGPSCNIKLGVYQKKLEILADLIKAKAIKNIGRIYELRTVWMCKKKRFGFVLYEWIPK